MRDKNSRHGPEGEEMNGPPMQQDRQLRQKTVVPRYSSYIYIFMIRGVTARQNGCCRIFFSCRPPPSCEVTIFLILNNSGSS